MDGEEIEDEDEDEQAEDEDEKGKEEENEEPVAKRHQMVTGSLALLNCFFYCFLYSYFNGSRAAAPVGDKVLQNGEKFRPSFCRNCQSQLLVPLEYKVLFDEV